MSRSNHHQIGLAFRLLLTAYCLLLTAYCLLPSSFCLFLRRRTCPKLGIESLDNGEFAIRFRCSTKLSQCQGELVVRIGTIRSQRDRGLKRCHRLRVVLFKRSGPSQRPITFEVMSINCHGALQSRQRLVNLSLLDQQGSQPKLTQR